MVGCMRGIYRILNTVTGHAYIGSSDNITERLARHRRDLRAGTHVNPRLQRAWAKYGLDAFDFETVCSVAEDDDLLEVEQQYIDVEGEYNIIPAGAVPSFKGGRHTAEVIERLRAARTGKIMSEESRDLVRAARTGRKLSPESVEKMRKGLTGQRRTPEQIARYRASWTPERRVQQQLSRAKLKAEDVLKIRERYPAETIQELAEAYSVTHECVRRIVRRLTWTNI